MNATKSMAGGPPLKALKDKMQALRDELDVYRDKAEEAEKIARNERCEREKV